MMLTTLLIDDQSSVITSLSRDLKQRPDVQLSGTAQNLSQASHLLERIQPHLIFLDIELPDGSGFDLLPFIDSSKTQVVFITAHNEFAVRAFECAALDYLLKPIAPERLDQTLQKCRKAAQPYNWEGRKNVMLKPWQNGSRPTEVVLKTNSGYEVLPIAEIVHCRGSRNYTEVIMTSGKTITCSKTLKEFDKLLAPYGFFRSHQSHLLQIMAVRSFRSFKSEIRLSNGDVVKLARSKQKSFVELLNRRPML